MGKRDIKRKKVLVMTGGGTAGHVTPNLSMIPQLRVQGWEIHYIGSKTGMERELVGDLAVYHGISTGKLRRYLDVRNLTDPFKTIGGMFEARALLKDLKASVVFAKGGFVSVPVVLAARSLRIPVVMHESDYTPGLANRIMKPAAQLVCTTFPETAAMLGIKGLHTGTPIRRELLAGDKQAALRSLGFGPDLPVLLVTGGSQGAQAINEALRGALPRILTRFQIIHLCGKGKAEPSIQYPGYRQIEYASGEMKDYLAACDIILSRAGANSIYEFLALRKPMLLIPLPLSVSRGDQILNAHSFERQGFARVLDQEDMTPDTLYDALMDTWLHREQLRASMESAEDRDAANLIIAQINGRAKL
jgi:UDP-N-acetylglucosamine--N-acetylmuramyl-(pentapeptide) pyrophosphoryl-undecaprenol N-acetylglucosamine transferase